MSIVRFFIFSSVIAFLFDFVFFYSARAINPQGPPVPTPRANVAFRQDAPATTFDLPELPSVPKDGSDDDHLNDKEDTHSNSLDFEDLNRRFENLKKKK
jgi:hypothetical protein